MFTWVHCRVVTWAWRTGRAGLGWPEQWTKLLSTKGSGGALLEPAVLGSCVRDERVAGRWNRNDVSGLQLAYPLYVCV